MAAPLTRFLFDSSTPRTRAIDNHYHIEMIAQNSDQVVGYHREMLKMQAAAAVTNLCAMGELAGRQDKTNAHLTDLVASQDEANERLSAIIAGLDGVRDEMVRANDSLDRLNETASATLDAIYDQTEAIQAGFEAIAEQMLAQHKTLKEIAKTLRRPYETQMLELREQADKWLTNGMRNTGRERQEDWNDATRLLREVIKNPVGNQDYVTWFQIGWLLWKHEKKIDEASEAFYRAGRLSAPKKDLYHTLSVRHLAYMQYLAGKHEEAYQTIQRVVDDAIDHDAPFDAARYAAKTGRKDEALRLLEKCIELSPTTIITMFAEEDFKG